MASQLPRVSVLLPARDAAATLGTCLRSLLRQSESRWECVLVDDASSDETRCLAETAAAADARIRVLSGAGAGLVPALELGLGACRAPLVARMDADDWMHRDRLRAQCDALDAHPGWSGLGCHVRIFPRLREGRDADFHESHRSGYGEPDRGGYGEPDRGGYSEPDRGSYGEPDRRGRRAYERWLNAIDGPDAVRREAFVECPLAHPGWVMQREVLTQMGYRDVPWPEDYDLLLRLLGAGHALGVVPRRLLAWRDAPERLSRQSPVYASERFTACKAEHLCAGLLRERSDYVLWGYGGTGRSLQRALRTHGRRPRKIVELHPGRVGQRIQDAPVVSPDALGPEDTPLLASVAGSDARQRIRAHLCGIGMREGDDFVCAA